MFWANTFVRTTHRWANGPVQSVTSPLASTPSCTDITSGLTRRVSSGVALARWTVPLWERLVVKCTHTSSWPTRNSPVAIQTVVKTLSRLAICGVTYGCTYVPRHTSAVGLTQRLACPAPTNLSFVPPVWDTFGPITSSSLPHRRRWSNEALLTNETLWTTSWLTSNCYAKQTNWSNHICDSNDMKTFKDNFLCTLPHSTICILYVT